MVDNTALVLFDGTVISERNERVKITWDERAYSWNVSGCINCYYTPSDVVFEIHRPQKEDLPCSTPSLLLSSPASSAGATTSRIKNTPQTQQHVLHCVLELSQLLTQVASSMHKLLAVISELTASTPGDTSDE